MKKYQCLIFDWDGTLMDSAQKISECLRAAATDVELPVPSDQQARNVIGLGLTDAMREIFGDITATEIDHLVQRYKHHYLHENATQQPLFSGVKQGLEELSQQGTFLSVATGKARAGLDRVLTAESMHDFFIYSRCADEARTKPHPQMLLDIMDYLALRPQDCLMIGDTEYDMQMAAGANVDALGVSYGVHSRERLQDSGAQNVCNNFAEVMDWVLPRIKPAFGEDYV